MRYSTYSLTVYKISYSIYCLWNYILRNVSLDISTVVSILKTYAKTYSLIVINIIDVLYTNVLHFSQPAARASLQHYQFLAPPSYMRAVVYPIPHNEEHACSFIVVPTRTWMAPARSCVDHIRTCACMRAHRRMPERTWSLQTEDMTKTDYSPPSILTLGGPEVTSTSCRCES